MKKLACLVFILLMAGVLTACAQPKPTDSSEMIQPGDKIGDFIITTGEGEDVVFVSKLHCPYDSITGIESCEQPVGTKVNVGEGIYDDNPTSGKTLDEYWSEQTHEMFIEGHPINLQAFGTIDFNNPAVGTVRVWNVVIVTDKPGKITAHSAGVVGGDPFDYTAALTFTAP